MGSTFPILNNPNHKALRPGKRIETSDSWWKRWWAAFWTFGYEPGINDMWLPFLIGVVELSAYPVLFCLGRMEIVGGWLVIKTAGQWSAWGRSRTAFNRFLFGNLCSLGLAYFVLARFVETKKTADELLVFLSSL
jgi:hypothetical protein